MYALLSDAVAHTTSLDLFCFILQVAEVANTVLGAAPLIPVVTRWNSLYDALQWVLAKDVDKINTLLTDKQVGLGRLTSPEISVLKEYVRIMAPICEGIDNLQGDKCVSLGYLVPIVKGVLIELETVGHDATYFADLCNALLESVRSRFTNVLDSDHHLLAAAFEPAVRLSFADDAMRASLTIKMARCLGQFSDPEGEQPRQEDQAALATESVSLMRHFAAPSVRSFDASVCVSSFVAAPDAQSAKAHIMQNLKLKRAHQHYNAPLPSSASVERLFSVGKDILRPKRSKMSDANFERAMFLRTNRNLKLVGATKQK